MEKSEILIKKLAAKQNALLPVYREKWLKIGLATGPGDRVKALRPA